MKDKELNINTLGLLSMVMGTSVIEFQERKGQQDLCNSSELPIKCHNYGYFKKLHDMGIEILDTEEIVKQKMANKELFINVKLPKGWNIKSTDHSMWSNLTDNKGRNRASIFYKAAFYDRDAFISFNRRFNISYKISDYDEKQFEYKPEYIITGYKKIWVDEKGKEVKKKDMEVFYWEDDCEYYEWGYRERFKQTEKPIYKKNPEYVPLTGYEKYSQPFHYEVHDFDGTIIFKSDIVKTDFEYSKDRHWEFFNHMEEVEKKAQGQCEEWLKNNYPDWKNDLAYWG